MGQIVKTFSGGSSTGSNTQICKLEGLPSIPADATLTSVLLSYTISRNGKGGANPNTSVGWASDNYYVTYNGGPGRNSTVNVSNYDLLKNGIINNNGGVLSYISATGLTNSIGIRGYADYYLFSEPTWTVSNVTLTINYTLPTYTATFKGWDGTVLKTETVESGKTPTPPTNTYREGYTFDGWSPAVGAITKDTTYTAQYTIKRFTLTAVVSPEGAGTVEGTGVYDYGTYVHLYASANEGWKFSKWHTNYEYWETRVYIDRDQTYTAYFERQTCLIYWNDENGNNIKVEYVTYGTNPTPPTAPTKADTAQWKYTFDGWYDDDGNKWTSDTVATDYVNATVFRARYTATVQKYTIRWYNYDGTLLETDIDVPYGTKPTYNGATPTKPSDDYYNYGFAGWSPSTDEAIQGDKNFTAQFAQIDRYYTVRWVNASAVQGVEGALLETDEVKFNTQPDYNGATPKHPKQDTDPALDYDFIGWSAKVTDPAKPDTELEKVKGNITYTAIYETTPKLYAITVILFDSQSTDIYEYGKEITIEAPAVIGYQFVKWTDGNTDNPRIVKVTGEATYQAVYEVSKHTLRVSYRENEGTISGAENGTYEYGTTFIVTASPKTGYRFLYWVIISDDIETTNYNNPLQFNIYGNITIGAVFEKIPIPIKVNLEQVTGCYIVPDKSKPDTGTIVYVINGAVPTVEVGMESVDGWSFLVSNSIPGNSYQLEKLFITDKGVTTRVY